MYLRNPHRRRWSFAVVALVVVVAFAVALLGACNGWFGNRRAPTSTPSPTTRIETPPTLILPQETPTANSPAPLPTSPTEPPEPMPTEDLTASTPTRSPDPSAPAAGTWILPPPFGPVPEVAALPPPPFHAENVNPLTGLAVDAARLQQRPLMVCVNNSAIEGVRPQYGLSQADLVYEYVVEGGITRYTALFWSHDVDRIGPVRSARLINGQIPAQYDALLACSGASGEVNWILKNKAQFPYMNADLDDPGNNRYFFTIGTHWETRMQTSTGGLRNWLRDQGLDKSPSVRGFPFADDAPSGGEAAVRLSVPFQGAYRVDWSYNATSGRYARLLDGQPHLEGATGEQLELANVVIHFAQYRLTEIVEDSLGSRGWLIEMWGEGRALILRDGRIYEAIWRSVPNQSPAYLLPDGTPFPFKPGNTWFEVVPTDFSVTWGN